MKNCDTKEEQTTGGIALVAWIILLSVSFTAVLPGAAHAGVTPRRAPASMEKRFVPPAVFQAAGPRFEQEVAKRHEEGAQVCATQ